MVTDSSFIIINDMQIRNYIVNGLGVLNVQIINY